MHIKVKFTVSYSLKCALAICLKNNGHILSLKYLIAKKCYASSEPLVSLNLVVVGGFAWMLVWLLTDESGGC